MASLKSILIERREIITLALMLELLHIAIWLDFGSPISRSFILVHLGLFLIWQPIWRGDEELSMVNGIIFIFLTLAFVTYVNWWLIFAWMIILAGFTGGRVLVNQQERAIYMIVILFLVSETIIKCAPMIFDIAIYNNINQIFAYALPVLPIIIILLPNKPDQRSRGVDFLHAVTMSMLISLLIIGSLLNMFVTGSDYLISLIYSLIAIGLFLSVISWLLSPRLGFSGLAQLWSQSLLNIGTPFEQWLSELSRLSQQQHTPDEFLEAATAELVNLPWIAGIRWNSGEFQGKHGEITRHQVELESGGVSICIYSVSPVGGSLYLHCKLLVQLLGNFYIGKVREKELTQQTHLQAIYETGARITHDIKNLLQSLQAITSIIVHDSSRSDTSVSQRLLEKQLPNLTQRLQLALDKLQAPEKASADHVFLKDWWSDLQARNSDKNFEFQADIFGDPGAPIDLFDSVFDNLAENLREKAQVETELKCNISLFSEDGNIHLLICDNGQAIPEQIARVILKEPVKSDTGLGIGLFQAARQAESIGYTLELLHNQDGKVCFQLYGKAS